MTPAIYAPHGSPVRLGWIARLIILASVAGCLAVLSTALRLDPDARRFGTHEQLGLERCQFLARTGVPCASCGMTTSFTHYAHGQFAGSFLAQPAGLALALAATVWVWLGGYIGLTGRPIHRLLRRWTTRYHVLILIGLGIGAWCFKIVMHLSTHPSP